MSKKEKIKTENQDQEQEQAECQECTCENHDEEICCHQNEECGCQEHDTDTNDLLTNRIKTLEDALLRSQAELLNYRKRKDEETSRILKYAEEDILKGFLPILDNFERAIEMGNNNNFGDEIAKFLEGFLMVYNQTKTLLEKFEVKVIDCLNQEFDPGIAQAIATEKDEAKPSGTVLKVCQKGYMYKDKIIRPAMVIVNE